MIFLNANMHHPDSLYGYFDTLVELLIPLGGFWTFYFDLCLTVVKNSAVRLVELQWILTKRSSVPAVKRITSIKEIRKNIYYTSLAFTVTLTKVCYHIQAAYCNGRLCRLSIDSLNLIFHVSFKVHRSNHSEIKQYPPIRPSGMFFSAKYFEYGRKVLLYLLLLYSY